MYTDVGESFAMTEIVQGNLDKTAQKLLKIVNTYPLGWHDVFQKLTTIWK